jgi:hypothetical protein
MEGKMTFYAGRMCRKVTRIAEYLKKEGSFVINLRRRYIHHGDTEARRKILCFWY